MEQVLIQPVPFICFAVDWQNAIHANPLRREYIDVKNVKLLEMTLDELSGEEPAAGDEVTIRGICYRVMQVQAPKTKPSKWRRRAPTPEKEKWRLLVQEVQAGD
jgi:hypothetical protein